MSSGRGGAGNIRLNTGSGLKGKGRANEDTITAFFGREISTVVQNVRPTPLPYRFKSIASHVCFQIARPGRGGAGNYNEPMSPDKKEQETQSFRQESMLIKERQSQALPIGGKARHSRTHNLLFTD